MNNEIQMMFDAIRSNQLEKAQVAFQSALQMGEQEGDVDGLAIFADTLHQAGFLDEAKQVFHLLQTIAPAFEEWELALAEIAIDKNELDDALDRLASFEPESEYYPRVLLLEADAYQIIGLFEVAEQKLVEANRLYPDEPVIIYALAMFYTSTGATEQAIPYLSESLLVDESYGWHVTVSIALADRYNSKGDFEEAIAVLEQIPQEEQTVDSFFQLGIAYLQVGEYERSRSVFEDLLARDPDYNSAYYYLAQSLMKMHQTEEAIIILKDGINQDPFQPELHVLLAKLFWQTNKREMAEQHLLEAIGVEPEHAEALRLLVDLYEELDNYEAILELLDGDREEVAQLPYYQWKIARALQETEQYEEAKRLYQSAFVEMGDSLSYLRDYSSFLLEEGDRSTLQTVIQKALQLDPNDEYFLQLEEETQE